MRQAWQNRSFARYADDTDVLRGITRWNVQSDVQQWWSVDFEQLEEEIWKLIGSTFRTIGFKKVVLMGIALKKIGKVSMNKFDGWKRSLQSHVFLESLFLTRNEALGPDAINVHATVIKGLELDVDLVRSMNINSFDELCNRKQNGFRSREMKKDLIGFLGEASVELLLPVKKVFPLHKMRN